MLADAAAKEKARKEALNAVDVKEGDYQIQVHIIEVRDLKGEDASGTSDPVVYAEVSTLAHSLTMHSCLCVALHRLLPGL